jgi:hypothetical protein
MPESRLRQGQVHSEGAQIDDHLDPAQHDPSAETLADTLSYVCSQIRRITGESKWFDPPEATLDSLRPLHLSFDWGMVPGTFPVGRVPIGSFASEVVLHVLDPFDARVLAELGTISAPAELMLASDSNLSIPGRYKVDVDREYPLGGEIYLNLIAPVSVPTVGAGVALIYLN